jgi:hypothetical protein
MKRPRRAAAGTRGFIVVIVAVGLFALAGTAGFLSVVINSHNNRVTLDRLTSDDATEIALVTSNDQDLLMQDAVQNPTLLTGFASLGTPVLPNNDAPAKVVGAAIMEAGLSYGSGPVIDYQSDPSSSWNTAEGAHRPAEGTAPTGGVIPPPPEPPGVEPPLPTTVTVSLTLRNQHSEQENIHIFRNTETFGDGNRIAPGGSRVVSYTVERGTTITMQAGRGGQVFASTTCTVAFSKTSFEVVWTDGFGLNLWSFTCN